jgi:hypothetical protein
MVADGDGERLCWRRAAPLSDGDGVTLALCTALARGAVEERAASGLCPACALEAAP